MLLPKGAPQRYVCINEYGVPVAIDAAFVSELNEVRRKTNKSRPDRCLELITFGLSDYLTIHFVDGVREQSVMTALAPVSHQRAQGGVIVSAHLDPLIMSPEALLEGDPDRPFHAVVSIKLDPFANALAGDRIPHRMIEILPRLLRERFAQFDLDSEAWISNATVAQRKQWAMTTGPDLDGTQFLPMVGLDAVELIVVVRARRLEWIARSFWAFRALRLCDLWPDFEVPADVRAKFPDLPIELVGALPLLAYSTTAVGLPRQVINHANPFDDRIACSQGLLMSRFRTLPGGTAFTDEMIAGFGTSVDGIVPPWIPNRFSVFGGSHDVFVMRGSGSVNRETAEVDTPSPVQPITYGQAFTFLRDPEKPSRRAAAGYIQETAIAVMAFPPGFRRPDIRRDIDREPSAQAWFDAKLEAAPRAWKALHDRLKRAVYDGHWPYPNTNGALNLVSSVVGLLATRRETEHYLDLVGPLSDWIRKIEEDPDAWDREALERLYKNLERCIQSRSHRDSPHRSPSVARGFEARSAYIHARDGYHAYLDDLVRDRVDNADAPLLVDGTDAILRVKFARRTGIFLISAQRLHNPYLWPATSHEVEHMRLMFDEPTRTWKVFAARRMNELLHGQRAHTIAYKLPRGLRDEQSVHALLNSAGDEMARFHSMDLDHMLGRPRGAHVSALEEMACDLGIIDSGVLDAGCEIDDDELQRRFLFTFIPNLAMDLRAGWSRRFIDDDQRLRIWALRIGARVASVLALAWLEVDQGCDVIQRRLEATLDSDTWRDVTGYLLYESWGRHFGSKGEEDSVELLNVAAARGVALTAKEMLIAQCRYQLPFTSRTGGSVRAGPWAAYLELVHANRRGTRDSTSEPLRLVADYVHKIIAAHRGADRIEPYPPLWSRGGLVPGTPAANEANLRLYDLLSDLRGSIRRSRVHALAKFLHPEL